METIIIGNPTTTKLAISLFGFHEHILCQLLDKLEKIKDIDFVLYLGLSKELYNKYNNSIGWKKTLYFCYDNYGADIWPFLDHLNHISEPYFIKLHTKKSMLGISQNINWLDLLLDGLIDSEETINSNIEILQKNPKVGIVANSMCKLENFEHTNTENIKALCNSLGIQHNALQRKEFISGTIFMSRTEIFKKYFTHKNIEDIHSLLKQETKKVSDRNLGTFSHSLERIFGYIVENNSMEIQDTKHNIIELKDKKSDIAYKIIIIDNLCYLYYDTIIEYNLRKNQIGKILYKNQDKIVIDWNGDGQTNVYIHKQETKNSLLFVKTCNAESLELTTQNDDVY